MSNSLQSYGLQPTRLLCPCDFPGKNTGMGCHTLLQGIFLTQGSNPYLLSPVLVSGFFTTSTTWNAALYLHYLISKYRNCCLVNSGKNCEVSEILLYIQVNELARCSVKDAGRKHEIPGSETKNFISLGIASSISFMFTLVLLPPRSQGQYVGAQVYAVYTVGFFIECRKPLIFTMS